MKKIITLTTVFLSTAAMAYTSQDSFSASSGNQQYREVSQIEAQEQGYQEHQTEQGYQEHQTEQGSATRWLEYGPYRVSKLFQKPIVIDVHEGQVNTIYIESTAADAKITYAKAYLSDGQIINIDQLNNLQILEGSKAQGQLNFYSKARVERIVLKTSSSHLLGPAAKISVILGVQQY